MMALQRVITNQQLYDVAWLIGAWLSDDEHSQQQPCIYQIKEDVINNQLHSNLGLVDKLVDIYSQLHDNNNDEKFQQVSIAGYNLYRVAFGSKLWNIIRSYNLPVNLGFSTGEVVETARQNKTTGEDYMGFGVFIYGFQIHETIKTLLVHKQIMKNREVRYHSQRGMFTIRSVGNGEYYRFQVNGNGRLLMDNFIVT
jgi:hypothetical protein